MVMNAGRIEQIGTPEQVYLQPASTFVAGFIGSPPMNLIEGEAQGLRLQVGGEWLPLPAPAPRDGRLHLGVRPEHARLGANDGWPMRVEMIEMLGAERLVHGLVGSTTFTLRIDATLRPPRPGETLPVGFAAEHLHWFDPATGRRI
jgi:sn-glycerol 3-phosphate transport system ATP-binding protein